MGRKGRLLIEVSELLKQLHAENPRPSFDEACGEVRASAADPDTGEYIGIDNGESDDIIDEAMQHLPEWGEDWPCDAEYADEGEESDEGHELTGSGIASMPVGVMGAETGGLAAAAAAEAEVIEELVRGAQMEHDRDSSSLELSSKASQPPQPHDELTNSTDAPTLPLIPMAECLCPVCLELLCHPVTTICGHNLCSSCLDQVCSSWRAKCPLCRSSLVSSATLHKPNTLLNQFIAESFPEEHAARSIEWEKHRAERRARELSNEIRNQRRERMVRLWDRIRYRMFTYLWVGLLVAFIFSGMLFTSAIYFVFDNDLLLKTTLALAQAMHTRNETLIITTVNEFIDDVHHNFDQLAQLFSY